MKINYPTSMHINDGFIPDSNYNWNLIFGALFQKCIQITLSSSCLRPKHLKKKKKTTKSIFSSKGQDYFIIV